MDILPTSMWQIKLGGIVVGVFLAIWGFKEKKLNENMTKAPRAIEMAELEKGGYSGSNHVAIRDFLYLYDALIYEAQVESANDEVSRDTMVTEAYIPIVSSESKFVVDVEKYFAAAEKDPDNIENLPLPKLENYTVVVKTKRFERFGDLPQGLQAAESPVKGIFINKISSLNPEEKKLLAEGCPGIDLDSVLILEEGRSPSSSGAAWAALVGGVVIALLSLWWLFKRPSQPASSIS